MGDEISTFVPAVASTNALEQLGTLDAMQQSSSAETFMVNLGRAIAALILSAILRR